MTQVLRNTETTNPRPALLVVDREEETARLFAERLSHQKYDVDAVTEIEVAQRCLKQKIYDLVLLDFGLEDKAALAFRAHILSDYKDCPVLLLVPSMRTVEDWAEELNVPVAELLSKPLSGNALITSICRALETSRQNRVWRHEKERPRGFEELYGNSPRWLETLRQAERIAGCDETVCLFGETGTGKSYLARAIHERSDRAGNPMITVVLTAGQPERQYDELFGHVAGSYTGATGSRDGAFRAAHRSTLFLDEVADLSPDAQKDLLRVLQDRLIKPLGSDCEIEVDVRVIAATNKDLDVAVREGSFREDLYYRLMVLRVDLPPLRERREDVIPLAEYFVRRQAEKQSQPVPQIAPETRQALLQYDWPGNIRELENCMICGVVLSQGTSVLHPEDCRLRGPISSSSLVPEPMIGQETHKQYLERCEKRYISALRTFCSEDRKQMAQQSGLHLSTIHEKLRKYDLDRIKGK